MNKDSKEAIRVSVISIIMNFILSIFKFVAGIIGSSSAMISDAVHSLSDVVSTIVVIVGINISNRKSDKSHQYGHERLEPIASLILSMILFVTGLLIGYSGILKIITGVKGDLIAPSLIALIAAIISIIVKEWMYQYTKKTAKKVKSSALMADAWHHRSDALSSIGSLIGITGAKLGFKILDPITSIVICFFIIKASIDIMKDATYKLVDKSVGESLENKMKETVLNVNGVLGLDLLKTRIFGNKIYVDIEISADKNLTLANSHEIAKQVHDNIESKFSDVKHCMVHVNPK